MKALVVGANGMLATDLIAAAPRNVNVVPLTRHELDILDSDAVGSLLDAHRPDWVINCAAYTRVDRAESEYDAALAVNGTAVGAIGAQCAARNTSVLHFSTDYVFPGDANRPYEEDDPTAPLNAYGRTKRVGEEALLDSAAHALILRTQWLYGAHGASFPRTMWDRARGGLATRVVTDQRGKPTYAPDLAEAAWRLVERRASGIYHVANSGEATWFDVASAIFRTADAPSMLSPCTTADFPTPAPRPRYSVLAIGKVEREHGVLLPTWQSGLERFLAQLTG